MESESGDTEDIGIAFKMQIHTFPHHALNPKSRERNRRRHAPESCGAYCNLVLFYLSISRELRERPIVDRLCLFDARYMDSGPYDPMLAVGQLPQDRPSTLISVEGQEPSKYGDQYIPRSNICSRTSSPQGCDGRSPVDADVGRVSSAPGSASAVRVWGHGHCDGDRARYQADFAGLEVRAENELIHVQECTHIAKFTSTSRVSYGLLWGSSALEAFTHTSDACGCQKLLLRHP